MFPAARLVSRSKSSPPVRALAQGQTRRVHLVWTCQTGNDFAVFEEELRPVLKACADLQHAAGDAGDDRFVARVSLYATHERYYQDRGASCTDEVDGKLSFSHIDGVRHVSH